MIARNLSRRYAPEYDSKLGITRTPLLLLQAPPAPDERRFYLHILAAVGAPATALSMRAQSVASLEVRVVSLLRGLGLRMIMIDEVHNLLAGTHREQRRFLNVLRYLSNGLEASLVCFGVSEAVDAIRGDVQPARRLDEHHLPNWRDDAGFPDMIQTLIAAMPLVKKSNLKVKSLKQILALTGGVTARISLWSRICPSMPNIQASNASPMMLSRNGRRSGLAMRRINGGSRGQGGDAPPTAEDRRTCPG